MKIAVDIDEVLAASFLPILEGVKKEIVFPFEFEDLIEHDWWKLPGCTVEKSLLVRTFVGRFEHLSRTDGFVPLSGSQEGIARLKQAWHTLYAITGRNEATEAEHTHDWLEKYFPGAFESVHFTGHVSERPLKKSDICKSLGVCHMIEDNLDFGLDLLEHDITVYLLEKPWNKWRTEIHPNLIRCANWDNIRMG